MSRTGKSLSSSPTVFDMNSQESDDTEKSAGGFGVNSLPKHPHAMLLHPVLSDPDPRRFHLKAEWQSGHGAWGETGNAIPATIQDCTKWNHVSSL